MPYIRTPMGITPPTPGLDHEEPEFMPGEDDIPAADSGRAPLERGTAREERPKYKTECE